MNTKLTDEYLLAFELWLKSNELSPGTIEKYARDIRAFSLWLDGREAGKETAAGWKEHLIDRRYAPSTINSMLAALNTFFHFIGRDDCRLKFLKVQRKLFRDQRRELSRADFTHLLASAREKGSLRLAMLLETMAGTGIRVSEVKYITVEAARAGRADIALKVKIRTILLPAKLRRKLLKYA